MEKAVKQAISLLLAAAMMISVLPVGAFAAEVDAGTVVLEGSADVQEDTGSENGSDTGTENGRRNFAQNIHGPGHSTSCWQQ